MPAKDPSERRALASIAALSRAATTSGADMLGAANSKYRDSFNTSHTCDMCGTVTIPQDLPADEIERRGHAAYRAHMRRLALRRDRAHRNAADAIAEAEAAEAELAEIAAS